MPTEILFLAHWNSWPLWSSQAHYPGSFDNQYEVLFLTFLPQQF